MNSETGLDWYSGIQVTSWWDNSATGMVLSFFFCFFKVSGQHIRDGHEKMPWPFFKSQPYSWRWCGCEHGWLWHGSHIWFAVTGHVPLNRSTWHLDCSLVFTSKLKLHHTELLFIKRKGKINMNQKARDTSGWQNVFFCFLSFRASLISCFQATLAKVLDKSPNLRQRASQISTKGTTRYGYAC